MNELTAPSSSQASDAKIMDIVAWILGTAVFAAAALFLRFGPRVFSAGFWQPGPSFQRELRVAIQLPVAAWSILVGLVRFTIRMTAGVALLLGILYGIVWVLHAMWRAT